MKLLTSSNSVGLRAKPVEASYNMRFVNFTTSGTYVVPDDVKKIHVAIVGSGAWSYQGGGQYALGGQVVNVSLDVTPGDTFPVLIGAALVSYGNGNPTSFGDNTATGGFVSGTLSPGPQALWPTLGDESLTYSGAAVMSTGMLQAINLASQAYTGSLWAAGAGFRDASGYTIDTRSNSGAGSGNSALGINNHPSGAGFVQIIEIYKEAPPP